MRTHLQAKLDVVRSTFAKYPMIPAMKAACARYSKNQEWVRLCPPLVPLTTEVQSKLFADLDSIGFDMPGS
jgi:4-hydroxy-tetrahydrodipicolinate synthase